MRFIITIVLCFTSIISNASIPLTQLKEVDTIEAYHEEMAFKVYEDGANMYVNFYTSDKTMMRKLIRSGFTLYFDSKGKKKKDVYFRYTGKNPGETSSKKRGGTSDSFQGSVLNFTTVLKNLPQEAYYGYFDEEHHFHKDLNSLQMRFQWKYFEVDDMLEFSLKIPKQRILNENEDHLSELTIGMVSNGKQNTMSKKKGVQTQSSGMRQAGGRGRGSGMRGGSGMKGSGAGSQKKNSGKQTQNVEYWFEVKLKN